MLTMQSTVVRQAADADAERIALLLRASFEEYEPLYTAEGFRTMVLTPDAIRDRANAGRTWVAVDGEGEIVGTVSAVPRDAGLYILGMAVHPSRREEGIGSLLLHHVESYAIGSGFQRIFFSITPFLKDAMQLCERFGFRRSLDAPYSMEGTPLYTMEKPLSLDFASSAMA